jgi:hypothetical protein
MPRSPPKLSYRKVFDGRPSLGADARKDRPLGASKKTFLQESFWVAAVGRPYIGGWSEPGPSAQVVGVTGGLVNQNP